jgi:ABC-2 type transport system ATP-binding protein
MNIEAKKLTKHFGAKIAVGGVDVSVKTGKILGLLGPNGAGKSTTIKMLAGQLKPDSGTIVIDGKDYHRVPASFRGQIGVMLQDIVLWDDLKLEESLYFMASLQGMSHKLAAERINWVTDKLQLTPEKNRLSRDLSGGYKRRLHLALTVLHKPSLLFLDEPSPGIDPQSRHLLWDFIAELRDCGEHAIILTDHYLDEAERLCDYVSIIDDSKIIAEGTVRDLKRSFSDKSVIEVELAENAPSAAIASVKNQVAQAFNVKLPDQGNIISLSVTEVGNNVEKLLTLIKHLGLNTSRLTVSEPSLEDVFLSLTGKHAR